MTIGAGLAIGPGIAGAIIQATGGFQQMLIAALATLILAFVLILPAARAGRA
jgi:cyanate permease